MAPRIYLSSTFADLQVHREKVYHALRAYGWDVIAMEDYVASDQRPLDKCLADVRGADVYIGIFAWRYGYVPPKNNPQKKSITERELREAERCGKHPLIFILKPSALWPANMMDATTGENERGARINALRDALQVDRVVGLFETADDLAAKVAASVYGWQIDASRPVAPSAARRESPAAAGQPANVRKGFPKLWVPGSHIRVRFLNGPADLHKRVMRMAQIWTVHANIILEQSDAPDAEIRVSFEADPGSWSAIGPDCLQFKSPEPTTNFGWLNEATDMVEVERIVVHEFGHVLGLYHEHQNPNRTFKWDEPAVYAYFGGPPNYYSKQTTKALLFETYPKNSFPFVKPFDPNSIMQYPFPGQLFQDGREIPQNLTLSVGDKAFISRLYPYDDAPTYPESAPVPAAAHRRRKPRR